MGRSTLQRIIGETRIIGDTTLARASDEQIKLFAIYLNTIGAGIIVTGIVAPLAASIINPGLSTGSLLYFGLACFALSALLHGLAPATLGRLSNEQ